MNSLDKNQFDDIGLKDCVHGLHPFSLSPMSMHSTKTIDLKVSFPWGLFLSNANTAGKHPANSNESSSMSPVQCDAVIWGLCWHQKGALCNI